MTVKILKDILETCNDSDRIIIDNGNYHADNINEVIYAVKEINGDALILQLRSDFDVKSQIDAYLNHCCKDDIDECDALSHLLELGFTLDDFKYDVSRYEWAKRVADDYGLI